MNNHDHDTARPAIHATRHRCQHRERTERRRSLRCRNSTRRTGNRNRSKPRNRKQRSHGTCRGFCNPCRLCQTRHFPSPRLRHIHLLRAVPHVPQRHILERHRYHILRQHRTGRRRHRLQRQVYIRRACHPCCPAQHTCPQHHASRGTDSLPCMEGEGRQDRILELRDKH